MFFVPKMLSVLVEDALVKSIDDFIKVSGLYSSRSEFLKDSVRRNLEAQNEQESWRRSISVAADSLRKKATKRGLSNYVLSRDEKEKVFLEFAKKNKIKFE